MFLAERLREAFCREKIIDIGSKPFRVTASFGVAQFERDWPRMVAEADGAMYRAKNAGRNRVTLAIVRVPPPIPMGD